MQPKAVALVKTKRSVHFVRAFLFGSLVAIALLMQALMAEARPESLSPLVDEISASVVNITTSTVVAGRTGPQGIVPEGSPFEDFFREFQDRNNNNNQGNYNKDGSSQQFPSLPVGIYFKIPRGWTDITRPVIDLINPGRFCKICSCIKDSPNGHETSECPLLPTSVHDRYRLLAARLGNLFKFRNGVQDGVYEPISMPDTTANPVTSAPQILKKGSGTDQSQEKQGE